MEPAVVDDPARGITAGWLPDGFVETRGKTAGRAVPRDGPAGAEFFRKADDQSLTRMMPITGAALPLLS
ncbi:hypothetical protein FHS43_006359 [Streptosporangium becharense]|uniref:Uncharacterized protein n=1 Tax=Streptosporangium becharense TaxID=1816182 RepID=A0A7W9IDE6_9ACTN|nr:hypothetical protein [Streptosporangium becharense]MBB5818093.1 hypothetical protein [Streptosporangium becharense]